MTQPKIALLYGRVDPSAPADEADTFVQVNAVRSALHGLGYPLIDVPVSLDLGVAAAVLKAARPVLAFNLVESIHGRGSLIHLAPSLLDSMGITYTGAPCEAIMLTSHKLLGKKTLAAAGIDTPPWMTASDALRGAPPFPPPWIVKSVWEHASIGLADSSVAGSETELSAETRRRAANEPIEQLFVEGFIEGREFNLALLAPAEEGEPESLPAAEILFLGYPEGKPKVVGYRAKWEQGSFEFENTPRRFDFPAEDVEMVGRLNRLSRECWRAFGLRGYARVDFRVDGAGRPWILEINTNPCLSPDAGFLAAAQRAGLTIEEVVRRIVVEATRRAFPDAGERIL
ncbi:MAG: D-alanine--D-alanine ligase [Spirochaetia bacterium]|jgi:D-alanine-D-alanine ligase